MEQICVYDFEEKNEEQSGCPGWHIFPCLSWPSSTPASSHNTPAFHNSFWASRQRTLIALSDGADGRSTLPGELDRAAAKQRGGGDESTRSFQFFACDGGIYVRSRLGGPLWGSCVRAGRAPWPLIVASSASSLSCPCLISSLSLGYSLNLDTCKH